MTDANKETMDQWFVPEIQYNTALKVANYANAKNATCTVDPATLLIIVNIIVNVIRLLYTCLKDNTVAKMIKNPGRVQKYLLYREVKKNFPHEQRKSIYEGLLSACSNLSECEVKELMMSV